MHQARAAKMSVLRDKTTATVQFRRAFQQIASLLLTPRLATSDSIVIKSRCGRLVARFCDTPSE
jgi:uracil phosphoribosyltransferase